MITLIPNFACGIFSVTLTNKINEIKWNKIKLHLYENL